MYYLSVFRFGEWKEIVQQRFIWSILLESAVYREKSWEFLLVVEVEKFKSLVSWGLCIALECESLITALYLLLFSSSALESHMKIVTCSRKGVYLKAAAGWSFNQRGVFRFFLCRFSWQSCVFQLPTLHYLSFSYIIFHCVLYLGKTFVCTKYCILLGIKRCMTCILCTKNIQMFYPEIPL